jgi:chemotaxis signal transduction protein
MPDIDEQISLLMLAIDGHQFALPTAQVQRVVRAVAVTPLPHAPKIVLGVIDVQGELLPVVSGRACFDLPMHEIELDWCYIVLESTEGPFALAVDAVLGVVEVAAEDFTFDASELISLAPASLTSLWRQGTEQLPIAAKIGSKITFLCYPDILIGIVKAGQTSTPVQQPDTELAYTSASQINAFDA